MKFRFSAIVFFLFCTFSLSGAGFGASAVCQTGKDFSSGFALDIEPDGFPFIFSAEALFCKEKVKSLSGGIEFLAGNIHLYKALNFFYAPELAFGYDFCNDRMIFSNAIYAGLNGFFLPHTEFFLLGGWQPQLLFSKEDGELNLLVFPVKAGIRFWPDKAL